MKLRPVIFGLILVPALVGPAASQAEPAIEVFAAVSTEEAALAILPPGAPGAASGLESTARCHPAKRRASIVALTWRSPGEKGAGDQRVDITKFREGFATGRYDTTRRLPAETSAVAVEAPEPGIHYYWRVLTESAEGWVSSRVERFEVPVCPWDESDPSAAVPENDRPSSR